MKFTDKKKKTLMKLVNNNIYQGFRCIGIYSYHNNVKHEAQQCNIQTFYLFENKICYFQVRLCSQINL